MWRNTYYVMQATLLDYCGVGHVLLVIVVCATCGVKCDVGHISRPLSIPGWTRDTHAANCDVGHTV